EGRRARDVGEQDGGQLSLLLGRARLGMQGGAAHSTESGGHRGRASARRAGKREGAPAGWTERRCLLNLRTARGAGWHGEIMGQATGLAPSRRRARPIGGLDLTQGSPSAETSLIDERGRVARRACRGYAAAEGPSASVRTLDAFGRGAEGRGRW